MLYDDGYVWTAGFMAFMAFADAWEYRKATLRPAAERLPASDEAL